MSLLSKVVSIVFQPLFLPIYAFLLYVTIDHHSTILIRSEQAAVQFNYILSIQILLTVIIPIGSLYVMYRSNIITSLSLPDRKERIPVLIITFFYYLYITYSNKNYLLVFQEINLQNNSFFIECIEIKIIIYYFLEIITINKLRIL